MAQDKQVVVYEKKISPLVERANTIEITTPSDATEASKLLSLMNGYVDQVEEEEDKIVSHAKQIVKTEQARWKPIKDLYKPAITLIRNKLGAWQTEQTRIKNEKEAKIAARIKEGKGNLSLEKGIEKMAEIEGPEQTLATNAGTVKFRTDKRLKITDETKIPRSYLIPDETAILTNLKAGKTIPGCEIEEVQVPISYR